ncbi:MAG: hypothetical protein LC650_03490 [Actinobacteria bacterium]|nr:hypothetical protein [Actinomycetota bacterium]
MALVLANVLGILAGVMAYYGIEGWGWFLTATVVIAWGAMDGPLISISGTKKEVDKDT